MRGEKLKFSTKRKYYRQLVWYWNNLYLPYTDLRWHINNLSYTIKDCWEYKIENKIYKLFKFITPFFYWNRQFINCFVNDNGCKYLNSSWLESIHFLRDRECNQKYYKLISFLGFVIIKEIQYIDVSTGTGINTFIGLVIPTMCNVDKNELINSVKMKNKIIFHKLILTKKQCINSLKEIIKITPNLSWFDNFTKAVHGELKCKNCGKIPNFNDYISRWQEIDKDIICENCFYLCSSNLFDENIDIVLNYYREYIKQCQYFHRINLMSINRNNFHI